MDRQAQIWFPGAFSNICEKDYTLFHQGIKNLKMTG